MSYLQDRIEEALETSKGNQTKARALLIKWAMDDLELLRALTRQHLNAIAAFAVSHIAKGGTIKMAPKGAKTAGDDNIGRDILSLLQGQKGATFGFEQGGVSRGPSGRTASTRHVAAINALARKAPPKPGKK